MQSQMLRNKALSKTMIRRMSQLIMKISSVNTGQPKVAYGTGGPSSFLKKKAMLIHESVTSCVTWC